MYLRAGMVHRVAAGILAAILLSAAAVTAVKYLRPSPPEAYALFARIDYKGEHDQLQWMAVTEPDCQAIGATVIKGVSDPRIHAASECVPENDRRVGSEWRTTERRIGRHSGGQVYFYGPDTEPDARGAYMLEIPGLSFGERAKIESVFADKDSCQRILDLHKSDWKNDLEVRNLPQFQKPTDEQMLKEDERLAQGVCTPVRKLEKVKSEFCDGLPFMTNVVAGAAEYVCDYGVLSPH
jgi:hypothetical protein